MVPDARRTVRGLKGLPVDQCQRCHPLRRRRRRRIVERGQIRRLDRPPVGGRRDRLVAACEPRSAGLGPGRADELQPDGRPSDRPAGIEMPGRPAMLTGNVQASDRYIATGSSRRAPKRNATVGDVGATSASKPCAQSASKSPLISVRTFWAFR